MTRSSEDVEREVEAAREDLDRTVEALKDKMTPGQLIDELGRTFKGGGAGELMGNLGVQVRENPMALAMIGAGMAWLMMGKSDRSATDTAASVYQTNSDLGVAPATSTGTGTGDLSDAVGNLKAKVGEVAGGVRDAASGAADHASQGLHDLGAQAGSAGRKAVRSFEDILQQEPLIFGALGLAAGVALGAAFPSTALEDKTFGAARDSLVDAGEKKLADVGQALNASGHAAFEAAKGEADRQGLAAEGQATLVEKAESVIRSGVDAARDELGGSRPI
ncbi:DUF3618 domain-containing protein [Phenylobacterium sp.]|uniref:DUF3618 domain-containing protein n=1 Tax=Phenylobacterium sp. TaxID=1871053 RepID=UPI00272F54E1|nr:DUF3618 domain-containing protein [Phenylobacterium sp.]MDP1598533.1 DUF3618 domain-containing protein [Phenylobacterium sp.]MDP3592576.1 DUF3618 domain-containing protein [Phenylobacterium sp.]